MDLYSNNELLNYYVITSTVLTITALLYFHTPGPAVIKLFESENELKYKNRLHDFIKTLCLFSKI